MSTHPTPIVLTIAGSDSGGGAGIQADIKAISATGSYACSAITAITAQNTLGVSSIFSIPLAHVESQLDAIFSDIQVVAVKIGMLADADIINVVAKKLLKYQAINIVLDPVMVATSGDLLLEQSAISTLKEVLIPLSDVITPNLPEAAALIGAPFSNNSDMHEIAKHLQTLGSKAVLLKGGHNKISPDSTDLLLTQGRARALNAKRIDTQNVHGTGCTLSSAIASYLAQGHSIDDAVDRAKDYITQAITHADELTIGKGQGPVNHFYKLNCIHD